MRPKHSKRACSTRWDEDIAHNTRLFYEADQLDANAYKILASEFVDSNMWAKFSEAKKNAEQKYLEAQLDLIRIKREMMVAPERTL